jgi:hypothetical protein
MRLNHKKKSDGTAKKKNFLQGRNTKDNRERSKGGENVVIFPEVKIKLNAA